MFRIIDRNIAPAENISTSLVPKTLYERIIVHSLTFSIEIGHHSISYSQFLSRDCLKIVSSRSEIKSFSIVACSPFTVSFNIMIVLPIDWSTTSCFAEQTTIRGLLPTWCRSWNLLLLPMFLFYFLISYPQYTRKPTANFSLLLPALKFVRMHTVSYLVKHKRNHVNTTFEVEHFRTFHEVEFGKLRLRTVKAKEVFFTSLEEKDHVSSNSWSTRMSSIGSLWLIIPISTSSDVVFIDIKNTTCQ